MGAETLSFRKLGWSQRLFAAIARATNPAGREVSGEIVTGRCEAWEIAGHGVMVTRLEVTPIGKTFVVVAAQGRNAGPVLRKIPLIARSNGAHRWRLHSRRPGMTKLLERAGLEFEQEYSLGESIYHGRV